MVEPKPSPIAFLPLTDLRKTKTAPSGPAWTVVKDLPELTIGRVTALEVSGNKALFFKLDEMLYAYRDGCPECGQSLANGALQGAELSCPGCNCRYDIRRAGRSLGTPDQNLEPIPLLVEGRAVKVALNV
ncbi:MAG: Rieske (2Fe-2S) protein [Chloroflexota bacterium]